LETVHCIALLSAIDEGTYPCLQRLGRFDSQLARWIRCWGWWRCIQLVPRLWKEVCGLKRGQWDRICSWRKL